MKKVVMTPNPYRDRNFKFANQAARILKEAGIESKTCLAFDVDRNFEMPGDIVLHDLQKELKDADLLICFGGDGTILHASKAATRLGIPVLGVNIGTMGFMAELESSELKELVRLAEDRYTVDERMMLHVKVIHDGQVAFEDDALNDAVITKGAVARTIQLSVSCDGTDMMSFGGDGVVISTPTGSTAYSMSAGGPIVEPTARNIVITPICAHDMRTRTVVTSAQRKISVEVGRIGRKNAFLSVDGGRAFRLNTGDVIQIDLSRYVTRLVHLSDRSFFDIVNNKLK
ncbi:MAG: NAD(+)/NADH kinase [Oscillospiraceae bacterium]|nr:NAD(+)/NADH kinase [Oscillospiraceae bacterium]